MVEPTQSIGYAASQRIASKLGNIDGFGADSRRVEQAGGKKISDFQEGNVGERFFIDPNDKLPFEGKPDLGHKPGHEFWRYKKEAESKRMSQKECLKKNVSKRMSQKEFNDLMNDPNLYQWENPHNNRSHKFEQK